jgi:hypothetical protein
MQLARADGHLGTCDATCSSFRARKRPSPSLGVRRSHRTRTRSAKLQSAAPRRREEPSPPLPTRRSLLAWTNMSSGTAAWRVAVCAIASRHEEQCASSLADRSSQANALARGCDPLSFSCHAIAQATGFDLGSVATSPLAEVVVPMRRVQSAEPRSVPADRPSRQSALAQSGKHPVHGRRRPGGQPSAQAAPASSPAKKPSRPPPHPARSPREARRLRGRPGFAAQPLTWARGRLSLRGRATFRHWLRATDP